jgi:hypothetical protein
VAAGFLVLGAPTSAVAQTLSADARTQALARGADAPATPDAYELYARSETYLSVFERALVPGASGALVRQDEMVPVQEYVLVRADRVDAPWARDALDFELSAWGSGQLLETSHEPGTDGDVLVARVLHRYGPTYVSLGRQIVAGGAARFVRFDGIAAGASSRGFALDGYGGLTVLPRWNDRPGYQRLGSHFDDLAEDPSVAPEPSRGGWVLGGGRVSYAPSASTQFGASFHEERQAGELGRRDLAGDVRLAPSKKTALTGRASLEVDSGRLSEALLAFDVYPRTDLDFALEARHVVPSLLLSRQSVLGVFAVDDFTELGTEARYRVSSRATLGSTVALGRFATGDLGGRARVRASLVPDVARRLAVELSYARVRDATTGYHVTRFASRYRLADPLGLIGEQHLYVYDDVINGYSTATVTAAHAELTPHRDWQFLLGANIARTPYASVDTRGLLRVIYTFHVDRGGT